MTFVRQIAFVAIKDLLVEWRSPARTSGLFVFALVIVVLVAFTSGTNVTALRQVAGGVLWIGALLASTRSLDQSFAIENDNGSLEGLVLWPVHPAAIFYGKALANWALMLTVMVALLPLTIAVFDARIVLSGWWLVAFLVLGTASVAAPGTLFTAITTQARASSVLLPLLLFPLVIPPLMAAGRGTTLVLEGDSMGRLPAWLAVLVVFNLLHWTLSGLLFGRVVEGS